MQRAADAVGIEIFLKLVALRMAHNVKMVGAFGGSRFRAAIAAACPSIVRDSDERRATFIGPFLEMRQFHAQHRALIPSMR